ncbi:MAG: FAD-dependent thymidylate synthase [Desulfobulbaceae bacterium]|nr:FAD-dependent thymidylate synthase [Desulfobulbaceae bacterium]
MIVVPPSFKILEDLDKQSLAIRIEACGRVCYKSEDKITEGSAEPFIKNIIRRAHNSVLEMAVLTLKISFEDEGVVIPFLCTMPKFLFIDRLDNALLVTGTVRAFREVIQADNDVDLVCAMAGFLTERHPLFYSDLAPEGGWKAVSGVSVEKMPLKKVDELEPELLARHRYVGVLFTVNRAVTHEIVRHRPCTYLQESQRYCRYSEDKFGSQVTFIKPLFFEEDTEQYQLWKSAMEETEKLYLKLLGTASPQAARTVLPNSCKTELITYANLAQWMHIFKLRTSQAAEPSMREVMVPLLERFKTMFPSVFGSL